ncbi:phosphotransferase family protein [Nesterenkonia jeotgali]|nr:phosphotransferase [Nesterenkonia jeotgali]
MNAAHPEWTEADAAAARSAQLSGARTLLDSGELSARLGRSVTISRVRIKPGHSVVAGFTGADSEPGWAMLTWDADKLGKARQRAQDSVRAEMNQVPFLVHAARRPYLFSGSVWADPVLAKDLTEARAALNAESGVDRPWTFLRQNPRRRVVAVVPPAGPGHGEKVIRVAARKTTAGALAAAQRWRELGLPVVRSSPVGGRGTALSAPLWGWADLSTHPHGPATATAGAAVGELHRLTSAPHSSPVPKRSGTGASAVALVAPWLGPRADRLAQTIEQRFDRLGPGTSSELHGDLSPDQVVLATPGSHKIRLIDLDRSTIGDPMRDLGSWAAACRRLGHPELVEEFLTGYLTQTNADLRRAAAWEAFAQLHAAPDAFRLREAHWPAAMERTLALGEEALQR